MNPELTDEQIRVAIAEACGYKPCKPCLENGYKGQWRTPDDRGCTNVLPDYLTSLDAIHEAEKVLTRDQCHTFQDLLLDIVRDDAPLCAECEAGKPWALRWTWHATARQRALALYATIKPQEGREKGL